MKPRDANTLKKVCSMPRDNVCYGGYWVVSTEIDVTIAKQKSGEPCEQSVSLPRSVVNRFVDWYNTGEWPPKKEYRRGGKRVR